ncbi:DUF4344 domain-containing metallopeptidase [Streptomyces morookaense]|uniref:Metallopeptidase DUF4344 n=1 Tax=Streptomyces morookaense TaxID=1970 RepID=A0A7Y7B8R9_STRMO|nr:DUF4344 domain-containing metallopeptidase [Streptomyces morookaense]NVK80980.1 hypothetical protein [Streptomyces morookaense]
MHPRARVLAVTALCALLATGCGGASAEPEGGVSVSYKAPAPGGSAADERGFLRTRALPERVAADLNGALRLPERIRIVNRSCTGDDDYPEYDPDTRRIVLCYEYVGRVRSAFQEAGASDPDARTAGVVTESLYHEAAHALVDTLELDIDGSEEDAADRFAAYRMIPQGAEGRAGLLAAADNYAWEAREDTDSSDEDETEDEDGHAPDAVRAANYRCYLHGSAAPAPVGERARQCEDEYRTLQHDWDELLAPHTA